MYVFCKILTSFSFYSDKPATIALHFPVAENTEILLITIRKYKILIYYAQNDIAKYGCDMFK